MPNLKLTALALLVALFVFAGCSSTPPLPEPSVGPAPKKVRLEGRGLIREARASLGKRDFYACDCFRTGEALQKIEVDGELKEREKHEVFVTFWIEKTLLVHAARFMVNGRQVGGWGGLEGTLSAFRKKLLREGHLLYPKVILDQRKEMPRSVVDDILSICFRVGIHHIAFRSREPLIEQ